MSAGRYEYSGQKSSLGKGDIETKKTQVMQKATSISGGRAFQEEGTVSTVAQRHVSGFGKELQGDWHGGNRAGDGEGIRI